MRNNTAAGLYKNIDAGGGVAGCEQRDHFASDAPRTAFPLCRTGEGAPESALLEAEFAAYTDARYCVAVILCGGGRR